MLKQYLANIKTNLVSTANELAAVYDSLELCRHSHHDEDILCMRGALATLAATIKTVEHTAEALTMARPANLFHFSQIGGFAKETLTAEQLRAWGVSLANSDPKRLEPDQYGYNILTMQDPERLQKLASLYAEDFAAKFGGEEIIIEKSYYVRT